MEPSSIIPFSLEFFKVFLPDSSSQHMVYSLLSVFVFNVSASGGILEKWWSVFGRNANRRLADPCCMRRRSSGERKGVKKEKKKQQQKKEREERKKKKRGKNRQDRPYRNRTNYEPNNFGSVWFSLKTDQTRKFTPLCIPPAFVEHFNGSVPSKAVLRDHSGKSWDVTLEELDDSVFFKSGWREFADYHLLKYGDFLVFQYDGSQVFDVKIFGKNGCKKKLVSGNGSCFPDVKIKDEPQSEQDCSKALTGCKRNGPEVRSSDSSGTAPKSRKRSKKLGPSKTAEHISTKTPTFKHVVKRWTGSAIQISKKMVVANNILLKPTVVLINERGRSWSVTAKPLSRRRFGLTTGWSTFFKENQLKMNDKCTFEFVPSPNDLCGEINVKITRSQARTCRET